MQDAFLGLYRRWDRLTDTSTPAGLRAGFRAQRLPDGAAPPVAGPAVRPHLTEPAAAESAEALALLSEEQRAVAGALRRLPRAAARGAAAPLLPRPVGGRDRRGHGHQPRHRQVRHVPRARRGRPDPQGGIMSREEDLVRSTARGHRGDRPRGAAASASAGDRGRTRMVGRRGRCTRRARRLRGWLVPVAAAAVVLAVAVVAGDRQGYPERPRGSRRRLGRRLPACQRTTRRSPAAAPAATTSSSATRSPAAGWPPSRRRRAPSFGVVDRRRRRPDVHRRCPVPTFRGRPLRDRGTCSGSRPAPRLPPG